MKYKVILVPKDKFCEDVYDVITFNFDTLQQAEELIEIVMRASNDCICQIQKELNGE